MVRSCLVQRHPWRLGSCLASGLLAVLGTASAQLAPANPGSHESVCSRSDVIFCEDWEDGDHAGWDWASNWDRCSAIANAGGFNSPNGLRATIPARPGKCGGSGAICHVDSQCTGGARCLDYLGTNDTSGTECGYPGRALSPSQSVQTQPLYQRFYVKYGPGYYFFDWGLQKLNYFVARVNDVMTWRVEMGAQAKSDNERLQWKIGVDAIGHDPIWFHNGTAPKFMDSNTWYCIEWMVKGNTPGQSDGRITVWVNDQVYLDFSNQNLKSTGDPITMAPWLSHYYGGNPGPPHPSQDISYDNIVVARQRIGCSGTSTGGDTPPGNVTNVRRTDTGP